MKEIPIGIGEYFLSFLGGLILYYGLLFLLIFVSSQIGIHFVGSLDFSVQDLRKAFMSYSTIKSFVNGLSTAQLTSFFIWSLLFLVTTTFYSFITMFWAAQIVNGTKNPFVALFKSIKFEFKNFSDSIILFIYISVVHLVASFINAVFTMNTFLYFISMIIYFYFVVYVVVVVFLYYNERERETKNHFLFPNE